MLGKGLMIVSVILLTVGVVRAEVRTRTVTYTYGGVTFQGHLAWNDAVQGKRPGVLVVHEFWGLNDYARKRAEQLARLGYVAFAADMYGGAKHTEHPQDAARMAGEVRKNTAVWQGRARAALKVLADDEHVDPTKLAAIGYCFGGSTALELAYSGADLKAVATFHAALPIPTEEQARAIKGQVLINHGAADAFIPEETCQKFRAVLGAAKVPYEFIYYGGAVHSFTVPGSENVGNKNMAYNARADRRSWQSMLDLFKDAFGERRRGSRS